ncbi:hypothetical protein V1505DRAFT_387451 [Lipomyces doorenjongii]
MEFKTLLEALRLVCILLPDDYNFLIYAANTQYDGRRLTAALLNEGRCPNSIADDLWHHIVFLRNRADILSTFLVADGVSCLCHITTSSGRISPVESLTWHNAAAKFSQSKELMRAMEDWVTKIFENLLCPIRRYNAIEASSLISSSATIKSSSSRDSKVRSRILARDGVASPLGGAIDRSAPHDIRQSAPDRVAKLEAAHIMPIMLSKYPLMQKLLSMFAGTNGEAVLRGKLINSPSNIFRRDHDTHLLFDEFIVGIQYLNEQYLLCKVVQEEAQGTISRCQDGEEVIFGTGPCGHEIDLPDGELFNIHLAIAKVLHASGAGEVISKILQDEEDFNEGVLEDGPSAARISAFALRMALQEVQAASDSAESPRTTTDCDDDNSWNKQQEHGRGV